MSIILVLISSGLFPLVLTRSASAAGQLTARSLQLSSGVPSKTAVQYKFTFTVAATSTVQSLKFEACTLAVGTCVTPTGLSFSSAAWVSQNSWQGAVNFATGGGSNDCTSSARVICATRSSATNQTVTSRDITFGTITNPSGINTTFFVRITTYSDAAYTLANIQDTGTTATATVQTLTVNANVAEVLNFCVGSTTINDATTPLGTPDCTGVSGSSLSLGNLDAGHINISPVTATNGGDSKNGIALLRTNGTGTTTVNYDAVQSALGSGNLGALRINLASSTCSSSNTDPCINSIGSTHAQIVTGSGEKFGFTIPGVNCANGSGVSITYACSFLGGTNHLSRNANYNGDNTLSATQFSADIDQITGTSQNSYAWDESGTVQAIASASSVVDDEALILKFAATSSNVTPFGAYSVQADFIAVPSY